jgi:Flp pilus assembly protein TadD
MQQDAAFRAAVIAYTAALRPGSGPDPRTAAALCRHAIERYPTDAACRGAHGAALYWVGHYKAAGKELEEAVKLQGDQGSIWQQLFLAMAYKRLGQPGGARGWFDKARLGPQADWQRRLVYQRLEAEVDDVLKILA